MDIGFDTALIAIPHFICFTGNEEDEHFLLHCPRFHTMRTGFFSQIADVPGLNFTSIYTKDLCKLLLYGKSDLNLVEHRIIIEETVSFLESSIRFY